MDITWLGHSALRIRGSQVTLVTDPFSNATGLTMPQIKADIVTVSNSHPHHSYVQAIEGEPRILKGPGEYEISNYYITGIGTPLHPRKQPTEDGEQPEEQSRDINTIFVLRTEGVTLCHLGSISRELSSRQADELSQADVLIVPVGGHTTLDVDRIAQLVNLIGPRIVIPVQYRTEGVTIELDPLERFLSEVGASEVTPQNRLSVTATNLPRDQTVVALQRTS